VPSSITSDFETAASPVKPRSSLRRFLRYVKPYWFMIACATLCGTLKFLLPASIAIAQRFVIDRLAPQLQIDHAQTDFSYRWTVDYLGWMGQRLPPAWGSATPWGQLNILMVTLVIIYALWGFTVYGRTYLAQRAGHRVILDLRTDLYAHITRLSHSFFQSHQSGGIVSRLMADIALAQNFVGSAMTAIWMDLATCVFYLCLLFSMDRPLAWASLAVFPFYLGSMKTYGRAAKRTTKEVQEALEEFSGDVQERVAGIQVVKSFAAERREAQSFFKGARSLYTLTMASVQISALSQALTQWLTQMATLFILWYGGYRVLNGQTSPGTVPAFILLVRELYMPMNRISEMNTVLQNSLAAIDRVFEVFDILPDVREKPNAPRLPRLQGRITFDDVSFGYSDERLVLNNIALDVRPGESWRWSVRAGQERARWCN
jgi:subfamily B ATP-binding cassette protein MsbA